MLHLKKKNDSISIAYYWCMGLNTSNQLLTSGHC